MAQSLFAGMTNYSEQTILDIKADIEKWIEYSQKIKAFFQETIAELKVTSYWETKIPFGFRSFCLNVVTVCDTFSSDFQIILLAINRDNVTRREIDLMRNIYRVACENETDSWKSFRNFDGDGHWHEYGDPLFEKVENLYDKSRDYFGTLKDVSNAAARMENYMKDEIKIQNNTDNSIHIGDNNKISKSNISTGQQKEKESWIKKWWWTFVVPIVAGLIVGIILYLLKMN